MGMDTSKSWMHTALKNKAKKWLFQKGYINIREEVASSEIAKEAGIDRIDIDRIIRCNLRFDVIGFKYGKPLAIECGSLQHPPITYMGLPFTVLHIALRAGTYPEDYPHRFGGCPYCNQHIFELYHPLSIGTK